MKMERREEELHLFKKKKALLLAFIYMNMIFETWLFQQDRIQRDVSQLRGPQTRKLHGGTHIIHFCVPSSVGVALSTSCPKLL